MWWPVLAFEPQLSGPYQLLGTMSSCTVYNKHVIIANMNELGTVGYRSETDASNS